ncbi:unnamed protein product, partial [Discosporangium mesarthrocarpum]
QSLEQELITEEKKLAESLEQVEAKGQVGYIRLAAQVDNYRKTRANDRGTVEKEAKARVLSAVLPTIDKFEKAEEVLSLQTENERKFNSNYQAMYRQLKEVFAKIGATDYFAAVGEKYNVLRHDKV